MVEQAAEQVGGQRAIARGSDADSARKADLALADQWGNKSMGTRKANEIEKEKKAATGGVTVQ